MPNKNHLLAVVCCILFVVTSFLLYGSAGHDDSHITFWASYTLSEFGEIVNYNGDRIEQSSSLLLTLLTALLAKVLHADVVSAGYVLTLLSGAAALWLTWQVAEENCNFFAVLLLASSPAFLLWNSSGMESTLAALCLLWFIQQWAALLSNQGTPSPSLSTKAALATVALISVRPEMIILVAALAFAVFLYRRFSSLHNGVAANSIPTLVFYSTVLLCICLLTGFRYFYFGSPLPLPVAAKASSLSTEKLWFGIYYLLRYGVANIIFLLALPIALVAIIRKRRDSNPDWTVLLSTFVFLGYSTFIVLAGGDWMQMGRFLVPVLPVAAILCAQQLQQSLKKPLFYLLLLSLLGLNILGNCEALKHESHGTPVWASYHITATHQQRYSVFEQYNQEHLRDMDAIDTLDSVIAQLHKRQQTVTLMSGQSGMVFFYTAKKYFRHQQTPLIRFYDSRALVENSLLKCHRLDDVPRSSQGLYFDFDGFFARQPALLQDCGIPKPDILYDINDMSRKLPERMAAQGYTAIHREGGVMLRKSSSWPANTLPAANFVMVANNLLDDLGQTDLKIIKYHEKPLVDRWSQLINSQPINIASP